VNNIFLQKKIKYKPKSFRILQTNYKIHAIYFFKKNAKSVSNFLEKYAQINFGFLAICKKK
jgi:hypothetical protein